ncbi:MAG: DNA repair protein RecO [Gammaproteobacteria bacterium]|nr:DNA repair protein RecO [Gammaproteobacteria bacterium]
MDNRVNDQAAFLLHRRDYQNSSLILELFTEDYGRISVLAKGARKGKNTAHFQPGNRLAVGWTGRAELKTLVQIDSRALPIPADCYLAMFYLNELLLYLLPKHDAHPRLFHQFQRLLLQLEMSQLEPLLRTFEMDLLEELGVLPDLAVVSDSAEAVTADGNYGFIPDRGVYPALAQTEGGYPGRLLLALQQRQFEQPGVLPLAKRLLRQIIDFNLQGRTLQSRQLYQQLQPKSKPTRH